MTRAFADGAIGQRYNSDINTIQFIFIWIKNVTWSIRNVDACSCNALYSKNRRV